MRPRLKTLEKFSRKYFRKNPPIIRWKVMDGISGKAELERNMIYLNPDEDAGLKGGCMIAHDMALNLSDKCKILMEPGEQYFYTLLHEIGHFKIRRMNPPSASFYYFKRKLSKKYPNAIDVQKHIYEAKQYFPDYWKYYEFRKWITGGLTHERVELCALEEFNKQRENIQRLLGKRS